MKDEFWRSEIVKKILYEFPSQPGKEKSILPTIRDALGKKVIDILKVHPEIAKQICEAIKSKYDEYLKSSEEVRLKQLYLLINKKKLRNPEIDERTIEKALVKYPNNHIIRDYFSLFVFEKLFENAFAEFIQKREKIRKNKLELLNGSKWYIYYYHPNGDKNIGRAILEIHGKENVIVHNVQDDDDNTVDKYEGSITLEYGEQHVFLDLLTPLNSAKHLRITVFIGNSKIPNIALGVYSNIYSNNSMVAGTLALQKINEQDIILEAQRFTVEDAVANGIDSRIIKFLNDKEKNFIKTPSKVLTFEEFSKWLKNK